MLKDLPYQDIGDQGRTQPRRQGSRESERRTRVAQPHACDQGERTQRSSSENGAVEVVDRRLGALLLLDEGERRRKDGRERQEHPAGGGAEGERDEACHEGNGGSEAKPDSEVLRPDLRELGKVDTRQGLAGPARRRPG